MLRNYELLTATFRKMEEKEKIGWRHSAFLVNEIFDFFFDAAPTTIHLKETVNSLVLVAGLNAAVVFSVPMSVNLEEFDYFLEQFEDGGRYDCIGASEAPNLVKQLVADSANSIAYSCCATLAFVLIVVTLSIADFDGAYNTGDKYSPFEVWYKYMRLPLAGGLSALMTGIIYMAYALVDVYMVKFPGEASTQLLLDCWMRRTF